MYNKGNGGFLDNSLPSYLLPGGSSNLFFVHGMSCILTLSFVQSSSLTALLSNGTVKAYSNRIISSVFFSGFETVCTFRWTCIRIPQGIDRNTVRLFQTFSLSVPSSYPIPFYVGGLRWLLIITVCLCYTRAANSPASATALLLRSWSEGLTILIIVSLLNSWSLLYPPTYGSSVRRSSLSFHRSTMSSTSSTVLFFLPIMKNVWCWWVVNESLEVGSRGL